MAERVHPTTADVTGNGSTVTSPPLEPISDKPAPPLGTYVIQLPKDQIYRVPPPENARKFAQRTKVKSRRSCCCRCFCWTLALLLLLLVLTALTAGILYLVFRPRLLKYTVGDNISIRGIDLSSSSSSSPITPRISVNVMARNPNKKLSVYYNGEDSSVAVEYAGIELCNGVLPTFYQPSKNTTVIETELGGSAGIMLGSDVRAAMAAEEKRGNVLLRLNVKAPVKIKVGSVKTWKITVKVKCDFAVDGLTAGAKVVSRKCDYSVKLW